MRRATFDPGTLFTAILIVLTILLIAPINANSALSRPIETLQLLIH